MLSKTVFLALNIHNHFPYLALLRKILVFPMIFSFLIFFDAICMLINEYKKFAVSIVRMDQYRMLHFLEIGDGENALLSNVIRVLSM